MGEFAEKEHTDHSIGDTDTLQDIAEIGCRGKLNDIAGCTLYLMPGEIERCIDSSSRLGIDEHGIIKLVKFNAQEGRLPLVAHAVKDTHGKLIALLILGRNFIRRLVGHSQQVIDLTCKGVLVHRDGESIYRVAHIVIAVPHEPIAGALQILYLARVVPLLPRHGRRQGWTSKHRVLEIMRQCVAVEGIQVLARIENTAGVTVNR